jgi:hypothetical protein
MLAEEPVEEIWDSNFQWPRPKLLVSPLTSASVGTVVSISGFILQFIGLRGSHWAVSIARLAATMLMTAVRALIRRRLSKQPLTVRLAKGFELEWLASTISKDRENFGTHYSSLRAMNRQEHHWTGQKLAKTLRLDRLMPKGLMNLDFEWYSLPTLRVITGGHPYKSTNSYPPVPQDAREVTHIRQRLGLLTQWRNPASDAAVSVANSIQLVLNTLLQSSTEPFTWGIDVYFDGKTQRVNLTVEKNAWGFRVGLAEIEALLSLWLQHVHLRELQDQAEETKRSRKKARASLKKARASGTLTGSNGKPLSRIFGF